MTSTDDSEEFDYSSEREGQFRLIPAALIAIYTIFIVVGILGNLLIVAAVHLRPVMRTARNVFIVTLALSDLVLCIFTMPTTLAQVTWKYLVFSMQTIFPKVCFVLYCIVFVLAI